MKNLIAPMLAQLLGWRHVVGLARTLARYGSHTKNKSPQPKAKSFNVRVHLPLTFLEELVLSGQFWEVR